MLIRSDTHLYRIAKGYEVKALPKIASATKRSKKPKGFSKKPQQRNPNNLVDVTAYYLGGKANSKGIFECSFMIEEPGVPKDEWPQVKFTGDRFKSAFSGYKQYQKVNLDLAKRTARRKK